jgi:hypothetical protein
MMSSHTSICASVAAACALLFSAVPAIADQAIPTEALGSSASPIRIDACRAALIDKAGYGGVVTQILTRQSNFYVASAVDFTNVSTQPVETVRFVFEVRDTFDEVTQTLGLDWAGTFTPDVQIHARRNLAGTVGAVGQQNTAGIVKSVVCRVNDVRFADGTVWRYGDGAGKGHTGLSYPTYPPSPAPRYLHAG